ncbi:hypothetical protein BAUCODRAFT_435447 [Baudoinia panamericana UAMH 10762]|uniref:Myb-like DNA-binding domain-containing protein n=1 Tax=Baudoinia panamericana (strain UAMH 10762) TaxID=717646 RepID=M2MJZ7_BAUPA|nr:uncharacterized protein BAUCODRAFT_435447 [Baudoinia panamericana UAMH 10762]EMC97006.1 hypothetical protein BAUCODRAFT_435447 [Baudoinia panamericana UAMH 10762]
MAGKISDVAFLLTMLEVHKHGAWQFSTVAEKCGLGSAKAAENRMYRIKNANKNADKSDEATAEATKQKTITKAVGKAGTPSKKRKVQDDDADDEEKQELIKSEMKSESDAGNDN